MASTRYHKKLIYAFALVIAVCTCGEVNGGNRDYGYGDYSYGAQSYGDYSYGAQSYGDYSYGAQNPQYGYTKTTKNSNPTPMKSADHEADAVKNNGNEAYGARNPEYGYISTTNKNQNRTPVKKDDEAYGAQNPQYGYIAKPNGSHKPAPIESETTTSKTVKPRIDNTPPHGSPHECKPTQTVVNGGTPVECAGVLIFEEHFNSKHLDTNKWKLEHRFATLPDYEFNMYSDNTSTNSPLILAAGALTLYPSRTEVFFSVNESLHDELDLGTKCTGRIDTADCHLDKAFGNEISPPLVTAQLSTKGLFSFKYGRVEVHGRLPQAQWVFPQLWLQPVDNIYGTTHYQSGQIRIAFSQMNGDNMELSAGVLLNSYEPWRLQRMCLKPDWDDFEGPANFHTYSMTWTEYDLSFAVDGEEYCKVYETDKTELPNRELLEKGSPLAPFDQEFHLTIGYGVGGDNDFDDAIDWQEPKPWVNFAPNTKSAFWNIIGPRYFSWVENSNMTIDWVKVYSI